MSREVTGWTIRFCFDKYARAIHYLHPSDYIGRWESRPYVFRNESEARSYLSPNKPWRVLRRVVRRPVVGYVVRRPVVGYVVRYKRADGTLTHYIDKDGWWGDRHVFTDRAEAVWHVSVNPYRICGRVLLRVR